MSYSCRSWFWPLGLKLRHPEFNDRLSISGIWLPEYDAIESIHNSPGKKLLYSAKTGIDYEI
jgi:hypothetical protein